MVALIGCNGCGVKPDLDLEPLKKQESPEQPELQGTRGQGHPTPNGSRTQTSQQATKPDVKYTGIMRLFNNLPREPGYDISVEAEQRVDKRLAELPWDLVQAGEMTAEEHSEKCCQIFEEEYGTFNYAKFLAEHGEPYARKYIQKAYAQNPNDFDTLLLYAARGGLFPGSEKVAPIYRRLYEMDSNHPWILNELGLCLYGKHPEAALQYIQKAVAIDERYARLGYDVLFYVQLGDYENALMALRRTVRTAPDGLRRGIYEHIRYVEKLRSDPVLEKHAQRGRELGRPVLWKPRWDY